jgi:antitoxin ChpS
MHTATLRKVGGSIMLAVPPAILDLLDLDAGATVGLAVNAGRLVVEPKPRPRYQLEDLLAECDASGHFSKEDRDWLNGKAVGNELL